MENTMKKIFITNFLIGLNLLLMPVIFITICIFLNFELKGLKYILYSFSALGALGTSLVLYELSDMVRLCLYKKKVCVLMQILFLLKIRI